MSPFSVAILLSCALVAQASQACPHPCTCYESSSFVDCHSRHLAQVPPGVPHDTWMLDLRHNNLSGLEGGGFDALMRLALCGITAPWHSLLLTEKVTIGNAYLRWTFSSGLSLELRANISVACFPIESRAVLSMCGARVQISAQRPPLLPSPRRAGGQSRPLASASRWLGCPRTCGVEPPAAEEPATALRPMGRLFPGLNSQAPASRPGAPESPAPGCPAPLAPMGKTALIESKAKQINPFQTFKNNP
uniref:LRRNT domain-containing protein n=1 Tax=Podarcis muralis TaxID=64176 RepID=A0A670J5Y3_PODMU